MGAEASNFVQETAGQVVPIPQEKPASIPNLARMIDLTANDLFKYPESQLNFSRIAHTNAKTGYYGVYQRPGTGELDRDLSLDLLRSDRPDLRKEKGDVTLLTHQDSDASFKKTILHEGTHRMFKLNEIDIPKIFIKTDVDNKPRLLPFTTEELIVRLFDANRAQYSEHRDEINKSVDGYFSEVFDLSEEASAELRKKLLDSPDMTNILMYIQKQAQDAQGTERIDRSRGEVMTNFPDDSFFKKYKNKNTISNGITITLGK